MTSDDRSWWQRVALSRPLSFVLPTLTALYVNRLYLCNPMKTLALPAQPWVRDETRGLLSRSEDRLRGIEGKGPGLAAVSAIVGAAVLAALVGGWAQATVFGRVLLGLAAWYSVFSLVMPIYLVGPLARSTVDTAHLGLATSESDPQAFLADVELAAAQENVRRTQRLVNLQDAARNEVAAALAVLLLWAVLGPVSGLLVREAAANHAARSQADRSVLTATPTATPSPTPSAEPSPRAAPPAAQPKSRRGTERTDK